MADLESDIRYTDSILNYQKNGEFGIIYSKTNENLTRLFEVVDVEHKDVYAVLSSSDLLFSLLYKQAKKVDCFDINPISYRYYFLRKWILEYGLIYADGLLLKELLYIVKNARSNSIDEEESRLFWLNFFEKIDNYHFYSNILFEYVPNSIIPYKENLKEVVEILKKIQLNFECVDICSQYFSSNRKYDMVFMSNILNYNRTLSKLEIACNNLKDLLNNKGSIICVNMPNSSSIEKEKKVFSNQFEFDEIFTDNNLYYKYTKK